MPEVVLIENVQTVTRSKTNVVGKTIKHLQGLGYKCREVKLTASHLGLPQRRTRHFSVGLRSSEIPDLTFQRIQEGTVEQAISDLLDEKQTDLFTTPSKHQPQNVERIAWLFGDGWTEEEKQSAFNLAPPGRILSLMNS